jgi:hypothetical protein
MPKVRQPLTDDSIKVRHLSHYQSAGLLANPARTVRTRDVFYDIDRRVLMFGTTSVGH